MSGYVIILSLSLNQSTEMWKAGEPEEKNLQQEWNITAVMINVLLS